MDFKKFTPTCIRKAKFYNNLVNVYTNVLPFNDKMQEVRNSIDAFFEGHWLKEYPISDLVCITHKVVKYQPTMRRKVAIFKALLAYIDAGLAVELKFPQIDMDEDTTSVDIIGACLGKGTVDLVNFLTSNELGGLVKKPSEVFAEKFGYNDADYEYYEEEEEEPKESRVNLQVKFEGLAEFEVETTSDKDIRDEVMAALGDYVDTNNVSVKITEVNVI